MNKSSIIISVLFLSVGFISAYVIFAEPENKNKPVATINNEKKVPELFSKVNPFVGKKEDPEFDSPVLGNHLNRNRLDYIEDEISQIKYQLKNIEQTLQAFVNLPDTASSSTNQVSITRNRLSSVIPQHLYSLENLIRGGIDPAIAEDIVRRKNSIELKRLELQNQAERDNYINTQRYYDELDDINMQDINLREELGDIRYDEYLYNSKQNNRIRITSVMLGSAAEHSGIQKGDVVLSYDNRRMFSWQELKAATTEGQLGEFVSLSIVRNGEIYSFTVPRGPLGTQLGATRLEP